MTPDFSLSTFLEKLRKYKIHCDIDKMTGRINLEYCDLIDEILPELEGFEKQLLVLSSYIDKMPTPSGANLGKAPEKVHEYLQQLSFWYKRLKRGKEKVLGLSK